jgi:hypothetical protein
VTGCSSAVSSQQQQYEPEYQQQGAGILEQALEFRGHF